MTPFRSTAPIISDWKHFRCEVADRIATLTFSRPEKLNALTFEVYADLRDLLRELPQRGDVAAVVVTGDGRAFCSGGDVNEIIGELLKFDTRDLLEFTRMTGAVIQNMRECPIPIVAAVNGTCAGAGAVIALAADFLLCSQAATFHLLFTKVGLSGVDMGSAYLLPRVVGMRRATELLMLGDPLTAEQAVALGLANRAVDPEQLGDEAQTLARRLADGPTFAYAATKLLLSREQDMDMAGALELEAMTQALLMTTADHREFHTAFTAGRPPRWTGR